MIKDHFKKTTVLTLISAVVLFFSLCCSPASMVQMSSMSMSSMPMTSVSNPSTLSVNDGIKTKTCLMNVPDCQQCKCKNTVVAISENASKKINLKEISSLTPVLLDTRIVNSRLAFLDKSPPHALQKSVPIYLFDRVLRL